MRRFARLAATGLAVTLFGAALPVAAPASAQASAPELTVSVVSMSPWTPTPSKTERQLSITVLLTNTTDADIDHVVLSAGRGTPVSLQSALTTSLADHTLDSGLYPIPSRPVQRSGIDVPAGGARYATFRTTTTTSQPARGLCLCANAVYPIYVSAYDSQSGSLEGFTRTYLASTDGAKDGKNNPLQKVDVAWVWPMIDSPHRLADGRVFTDRTLLTSLAPDGRLYRALQVAGNVGADTPITVMLDPDLVDEVGLLAGGNFSYLSSAGRKVAGSKVAVAQTWLAQLRAVLAEGDVTLEFTPYADPDIQSLSSSHLRWQTRLPPTMLKRIQQDLGLTTIPSSLSWPPTGAVTQDTLNSIAAAGATSVLLDDSAVRPTKLKGLPTSSAILRTSNGTLHAALTSPAIQSAVAASIRNGDPTDLSHLPTLLAELAVRADDTPFDSRVAFLTPPRYVDADPTAAETVIRETTSSAFSDPMSVGDALTEGAASGSTHFRPRHLPAATPGLSAAILQNAHRLSRSLVALRALVTGKGQSPAAIALLADLTRGLQRVESATYLSSSTLSTPTVGARLAAQLRRQVSGLLAGVHIVRPESGRGGYTYTLASKNSPLPITVVNSLPYRAFVHITVATDGGLPGLTTTDIGMQSIAADSKQTFRVPAHVQRSGRIALTATLTTVGGHNYVLGPRVHLTVHSTVFGTIGVIITVVAALVLLLALVLRYIRRIQRLRRKRRASTADPPIPARVA